MRTTRGNGEDDDDNEDDDQRCKITNFTPEVQDDEGAKSQLPSSDSPSPSTSRGGDGGGGSGDNDSEEYIRNANSERNVYELGVIGEEAAASSPLPISQTAAELEEEGEGGCALMGSATVQNHSKKELAAKKGSNLDVVGYDDEDENSTHRALTPMQQQLVCRKSEGDRRLEVIGDGEDYDEYINAPVPIQQQLSKGNEGKHVDEKKMGFPRSATDAIASNSSSLFDGGLFAVATGSVYEGPIISAQLLTIPTSSTRRMMTDDDDDDDDDEHEVIVAEARFAHPWSSSLPIIRASFLVDENIYDAYVLKDNTACPFKYAVGGLVLIIVVAVSALALLFQRFPGNKNEEKEGKIMPNSDAPSNALTAPHRGVCFANRTELMTAIDRYDDQGCSNFAGCEVGRMYGWPMNSWCVTKINDMSELFSGRATQDISDWDVSSVTDMSYMFYVAIEFNVNVSSWDVSSVTDMSYMFYQAEAFNCTLSRWDVSSVTNMSSMFFNAFSFNGNLSSWNVSSVTNMKNMFYGASTFNSDLSNWDVSSVTFINNIFDKAAAFNSNLSNWDVSSVTIMNTMFNGATAFNGDLSSWDVSSITDMESMFNGAATFNGDLSNWDVSSVTNMNAMFAHADSFNGDLSSWDVGSVTEMSGMFFNAASFNSDLSSWDVGSVTQMSGMFFNAASFNSDLSSWDVSSVTNISWMFFNASTFNGNLLSWNVSSATLMNSMFDGAVSFNGDLSKWNVNSVANMTEMFRGAASFNQDLCTWADNFPYDSASDILLSLAVCCRSSQSWLNADHFVHPHAQKPIKGRTVGACHAKHGSSDLLRGRLTSDDLIVVSISLL